MELSGARQQWQEICKEIAHQMILVQMSFVLSKFVIFLELRNCMHKILQYVSIIIQNIYFFSYFQSICLR